MKKKNAFTLVELLVTIAVIITLALIVTPKIMDVINDNRNKAYYEVERRLEEAAAKYIVNEYISSDVISTILTKDDLINSNYIDEVNDLKESGECDAYVYVSNLDGVAEYNAVLDCPSYKTKDKNASGYINYLYLNEEELNNGLYEPLLEDGTSTGIRYRGSNPNNYVYFNCKDKDSNNIKYGNDNYDYASSCEIWRIVGVFEVDNGKGNIEKRMKIVRDELPVAMSFDSSVGGENIENSVNYGYGINQWGPSTYEDGSEYEGADLMRMLNGYYIGEEITCTYCNALNQVTCSNVCTSSITPISNISLNMVEDAVWNLGVVTYKEILELRSSYQEEKGKNVEKICVVGNYCNDEIVRTTKWVGKIALIYPSDYGFASIDNVCASDIYGENSTCKNNNWLHPSAGAYWTLTSVSDGFYAGSVWFAYSTHSIVGTRAADAISIRPSLYLKSSVKIVSGDGTEDNPYILK